MWTFEINILAVIAAVFAAIILGSIWYTPKVFGNAWMKLSGITKEQAKKAGNMAIVKSILFAAVMALVLEYVLTQLGADTWASGLWYGFVLWLGLVATTLGTHYAYENKPRALYGINAGYQLALLVVMGAILAAL